MESGIDPRVLNFLHQVAGTGEIVCRVSNQAIHRKRQVQGPEVSFYNRRDRACRATMWAGYSGWLGAFASGQFGSAASAGLSPPAWIAVTGRQKLKLNFAFQQPMPASAYPGLKKLLKNGASLCLD